MTLCVGAICENGETIVMANDLMITFGGDNGDANIVQTPALMKDFRFMNTWLARFAWEVTPVEPVMNRVLKRLENAPNTFPIIVSAFTESFQEERTQEISNRITAKYGISYEKFLNNGKKLFQQGQYKKILDEIGDYKLGTEFLVGGFDETGKQHLFTIYDPGCAEHYTGLGYWAIGIGQEHALRMFAFRGYNWEQVTTTQGIYLAFEAKVFGEGPCVGRETIVTTINGKKASGLHFYAPTNHPIRLLIKQGKRSEAEAQIAKVPWQPLTP